MAELNAVWKSGEIPTFRADVRNGGKTERRVAQAQQLSTLELDGVPSCISQKVIYLLETLRIPGCITLMFHLLQGQIGLSQQAVKDGHIRQDAGFPHFALHRHGLYQGPAGQWHTPFGN